MGMLRDNPRGQARLPRDNVAAGRIVARYRAESGGLVASSMVRDDRRQSYLLHDEVSQDPQPLAFVVAGHALSPIAGGMPLRMALLGQHFRLLRSRDTAGARDRKGARRVHPNGRRISGM